VQQWVPLQVAFGSLRSLALAALFLYAGAYGREIVSSAGSAHVFSSHPGGQDLVAPLVASEAIVVGLIFGGKSARPCLG